MQTKWIYGYAKHYWSQMIFYTALGMVVTVISLLSTFVSRDLVDIITGYRVGALIRTFAAMIGIGVLSTILNLISNYASTYISMKVDNEIKADVFEKIMVTDWESLSDYHSGDLMTRWNSDVSNISNGVLNYIPNLIIYVFRFISALWVVIAKDWTFAIFAFLSIPVELIMSRTLLNRMVSNNEKSMEMSSRLTGFNQETFLNIEFIKSFDLLRLYIKRLHQLQKEYMDMSLGFQKVSMWTSLLMSLVGMAVSYSAYGWGIYRVWTGAITYGSMTMFLGLSGTLTGTVNNLTSLVPQAIRLTTSAGRLMKILDMPREDYRDADAVDAFAKRHKADGVSLYVEDVDYSYMNGTEVFARAALEAHPHEIIAVIGPSGKGKTTLMRLLLSITGAKKGRLVLTGGRERPGDPIADVHDLSYVPQGNTMFSGSIAYNMRNVKPDATDEEIIDALKKADAWEFVAALPAGIDSEIKEKGGGFSEGQAQRLSIARALLRRSPLLLLDEATSALDMETEHMVLSNITKDEYPRTCIVTTHRPSVLASCTRVYRIEDRGLTLLSQEEVDGLVKKGW